MKPSRRSGILMHPTSLPGRQAIGSLGPEAFAFIDLLAAAGQSVWQILPLGPTGYGHCPYSCFSAFAGNPLLISLEQLVAAGDLQAEDLSLPGSTTDRADFAAAEKYQLPRLRQAWQNFLRHAGGQRQLAFQEFCANQTSWLDDYVFFAAMREDQLGKGWQDWPIQVRNREPEALQKWAEKLRQPMDWQKYLQFVFFEQWEKLKTYANDHGISIFGDLPIFVAEDSADVWANPHLFYLDEQGQPQLVAGVPPDYFSETGQRWGNPLYRWERMAAEGYSWWLSRFSWNLHLFDLVRVDHFRGFDACWAIPGDEPTAVNGSWMPVPGRELFQRLREKFNALPIIAEDLGVITPEVEKLRDDFGLPGMKILQFAFDSGPSNPYLPHNHIPNSVVYTGTHDNNTSLGWWQSLASKGQHQVREYLRRPCQDMPWPLIETALASVSELAIIPLQDLLGLDGSARMNRPATVTGNWDWRLSPEPIPEEIIIQFRSVTQLYGRLLCNPTEMH